MIVTSHAALDALLTGSTHYMRVESGEEAIVYYVDRARAHTAASGGHRMHGSWRLPEGVARAEFTRIVPGDAAGLAV